MEKKLLPKVMESFVLKFEGKSIQAIIQNEPCVFVEPTKHDEIRLSTENNGTYFLEMFYKNDLIIIQIAYKLLGNFPTLPIVFDSKNEVNQKFIYKCIEKERLTIFPFNKLSNTEVEVIGKKGITISLNNIINSLLLYKQ